MTPIINYNDSETVMITLRLTKAEARNLAALLANSEGTPEQSEAKGILLNALKSVGIKQRDLTK